MLELKPKYSTTKSFYKKAIVRTTIKGLKLYSYNQLVAEIIGKNATVYHLETDSTIRHVIEFLKQNNFKAENKKQILEDYSKTV